MLIWLALLFTCLSPPPSSELPDPKADSLTVYIFLHDECVISQYYTPELTRLADAYKQHHIGFIGVFPMADQDRIDAFATAYQLTFPLIPDTSHHQVTLFDATMMPQAVVWDHRTNRLLYRGRIDDSYVRVGKRNLHPKSRDLENIVKKWLDGIIPDHLVETQAIGCVIDRRS